MGNVPYQRVTVQLAVVPARGMACSSFVQERKGSTLGLGATRVPDSQAGAAIREEEAMVVTMVVPAGSSPWWCHTWAFANIC